MDESGNYSSEFNATANSKIAPEALLQEDPASASAEVVAETREEQDDDLKVGGASDSD